MGHRSMTKETDVCDGVYMPKDLSLAQMLNKYSPSSENDTASLIRSAIANINAWRGLGPGSPPPPVPHGAVTYGRVPVPPGLKNRIIPDAQTHAWDNLGQRVLRGIVYHRMLGTLDGTDQYFRSGAAGLTDWGI